MKSNISKWMFAISLIAGWAFIALPALGQTPVVNPLDGQNNPKPLAVLEAVQPYQDQCQIYISNGSFGTCNFQPVPKGKRLVIEEFDSFGYMNTGIRPVMIDLENGYGSDFFPVTAMGTSNGLDFFASHNATRVYPVALGCILNLSGTAYSVNYTCHFSGFLVDLP